MQLVALSPDTLAYLESREAFFVQIDPSADVPAQLDRANVTLAQARCDRASLDHDRALRAFAETL